MASTTPVCVDGVARCKQLVQQSSPRTAAHQALAHSAHALGICQLFKKVRRSIYVCMYI
jgi:methylmalonyl-CoA mutase cobalamin-binding subunit